MFLNFIHSFFKFIDCFASQVKFDYKPKTPTFCGCLCTIFMVIALGVLITPMAMGLNQYQVMVFQ
jgi:hypothetical protein